MPDSLPHAVAPCRGALLSVPQCGSAVRPVRLLVPLLADRPCRSSRTRRRWFAAREPAAVRFL